MNLGSIFLLDDWKKIPQNLRYIFFFGVFSIAIVWLVDHWGNQAIYTFWWWDFRATAFSLGVSLIIFGFFALIYRQFIYFKRSIIYRHKYPIKKYNKTFTLIHFDPKIILFDLKSNKYHHVHPRETAEDLLFMGVGKRINTSFERALYLKQRIKTNDDIEIDLSKFMQGDQINTRL